MSFPFYVGNGNRPDRMKNVPLPVSRRAQLLKPETYIADPGLIDACNVALLLGQPLLLTGEPGTGKTQFAYNLAWELGLGEPIKFETKSNSTSNELFYTYDALKHFQDAQNGIVAANPLPYITYRALGTAILRTREYDEVANLLHPGFVHAGKCRSIVLIDEVDKAPRDFPNDFLNELELMYFRIPEIGDVKIEADPELQPIVIFTSNSEKDLPDAFLRRCIYYHIPFPSPKQLADIVANRFGLYSGGSSQFINDALSLFSFLRNPGNGLRKKPSTAELLGWIVALTTISGGKENPLEERELALRTLSNLVKTAEDQDKAMEIVKQWVTNREKSLRTG